MWSRRQGHGTTADRSAELPRQLLQKLARVDHLEQLLLRLLCPDQLSYLFHSLDVLHLVREGLRQGPDCGLGRREQTRRRAKAGTPVREHFGAPLVGIRPGTAHPDGGTS